MDIAARNRTCTAIRTAALTSLLALAAACGGGAGGNAGAAPGGTTPPAGGPGAGSGALASAPSTPAPAAVDPNPPAVGASGSNRFQMGAADGLYLVDPVQGEPSVTGLVVVTLGPVGTGNFIPPADTTVTMNGVPLLRDPNLNGAYWRVDPAGPQPVVGTGGRMVLVASATIAGAPVERTLVLPCPSDVAVSSSPGAGSALAVGSSVHLSSASDLTLNPGVPMMASKYPEVTLYGYDPDTRSLAAAGGPTFLPPGPLSVDVAVAPTVAPAYLLDLRWPGQWVIDGETGGFCGLAKRAAFAKQ
jgi:hypothetical protein